MAFQRTEIPRLTVCRLCGYVACTCAFQKAHAETCQRRLACLDTSPTPCKPHDVFACADCNPCTCAAVERSAAE